MFIEIVVLIEFGKSWEQKVNFVDLKFFLGYYKIVKKVILILQGIENVVSYEVSVEFEVKG